MSIARMCPYDKDEHCKYERYFGEPMFSKCENCEIKIGAVIKQRKMKEEHRIIKRTELEVYYVESGEEKQIGEFTEPLYIRKTKHYEYEQFHCNIKHKNINLGNWDFNYCPFCGKEIKEK